MFAGPVLSSAQVERIDVLAGEMQQRWPQRELLLPFLVARLYEEEEEIYRLLCDAARDPLDALAVILGENVGV